MRKLILPVFILTPVLIFLLLMAIKSVIIVKPSENQSNITLQSLDSVVKKNNQIIIDSIRNLQPYILKPKANRNKWGYISLIFHVLIPVLLLAYIFTSKKETKKKILTATITAWVLEWGLESLLKIEPQLEFEFKNTIETKPCDTVISEKITKHISIGPFISGFDTINPDTLRSSFQALREEFKGKKITSIFIIGCVDKRPLKRKALIKFGDNLTLAQARANKIRDSIIKLIHFENLPEIFTLTNGAANYYDSTGDYYHSLNRNVLIYARYRLEKNK